MFAGYGGRLIARANYSRSPIFRRYHDGCVFDVVGTSYTNIYLSLYFGFIEEKKKSLTTKVVLHRILEILRAYTLIMTRGVTAMVIMLTVPVRAFSRLKTFATFRRH